MYCNPRRTASAAGTEATGVDFDGTITVRRCGRCGDVEVAIDGSVLSFPWEFGGGDCIAFLDAPDARTWRLQVPHRRYEREPFLAWMAGEIAGRECPGAGIEIDDRGIVFRERRA